MNSRILTAAIASIFPLGLPSQAAEFLPITSISQTAGSPIYTTYVLDNLRQGSGTGFDANEPHDQLGTGGAGFAWVTTQPNGGGDYFPVGVAPLLVFDLGSDVLLSEISTWGYADGNSNGARDFSLRFATEAEGTGSFGTSITYNPSFIADHAYGPRNSNSFSQNVVARYVEMTVTDNWRGFNPPGVAGGDRVGLGEVAFENITITGEPNIVVPSEVTPALADDANTTFTIPVTNTGEFDLTINGTNRTGPNALAFTVTNVVTPVSPQSIENITLEFDPTGLGGAISATLQIMSNDPDTPAAEVLITAALSELGSDIAVPGGVDFGGSGVAATLPVPIQNLGRAQLDITAHEIVGPSAAAFSASGVPANVAPLSTTNFDLNYDPAGLPAGGLSATLRLSCNDPDTPVAEIPLLGGIPTEFYPISSATSATVATDFFPAGDLIQGPGVGYDADWPHGALGEAANFAWVTNAPNGGAGDFFSPLPDPAAAIVLDLGGDVPLAEISFWGYADANANGASSFSLRFATDADGTAGFGNTISYSPTFTPLQDLTPRQSFAFDQTVTARYVEWTPLDNFFGINPPGGDRVGAGEIAFEIVPGSGARFEIVSIVRNSPTSASITFNSQEGVDYAVDRSTDLIDWGDELTDNATGEAGPTTTYTDDTIPADATEIFYRVRHP